MDLLLRLQSAAAVVLMFIETLRCLNLTGVTPCTEGVVFFSDITYAFFTVIKLNIELAALVAKNWHWTSKGVCFPRTEAEDLHGESLAEENVLQAGKRVENRVVTGGGHG